MRDTLINNFLRISNIPRISGNEKRISDFFVEVAKKNNLEYYQDKNYNVLIKKKGNIPGDTIAFQAHLDIVGVKTSDSNHDFINEGIEVIIDGDRVTANNTTLGADQGVGLAIMLTFMEDKTLSHPDLEFLFTVEEETTFKGVINFPYDKLTCKQLINLDYVTDDAVVIGSASDLVNEYIFKASLVENEMPAYKVRIDGFPGGNSGENINESANNAIITMFNLLKNKDIYIRSVTGGFFENDVATDCEVVLNTNLDINNLFKGSDAKIECIDNKHSFSKEDTIKIINEILSLKSGYISDTISANLGTIRTNDNEIRMKYLIRSINQDEIEKLSSETKNLEYNFEVNRRYTEDVWKIDDNSILLEKYRDAYFSLYNEYPRNAIALGGLECGYISNKLGLDVISIGAIMNNVHSVDEETYISSWLKIYNILVEFIKQ